MKLTNNQSMHRVAIYLLVLLLAACGAAPVVKPNEPVKVKSATFVSTIKWNQFGDARQRLWTLDGPMLNELLIYVDIKPGESLTLEPRGWSERHGEGKLFRKGMDTLEFKELLVDALQSTATDIKVTDVRPAKFGSKDGVRFDLSFVASAVNVGGKSGLRYRATVLAELQDDSLSYLYFSAPEEFYYQRDIAAVEQIFANIKTQ